MINKPLLNTFLSILETRNFNRTAINLNITQSTVSSRIRQLEKELGNRLFERGRGGAEPTAAGYRFEEHCRLLLASWGHIVGDMNINHQFKGALRISSQYNLLRPILVEWIEALRKNDKDTALHVEADFSAQIMQDLLIGKVDVGVVYSPEYYPDLDITEIGCEDYVMVSTSEKELSEIDQSNYLRTGYSRHFDRQHEAKLPEISTPAINVGSNDLALELLGRLEGACYLPRAALVEIKRTFPRVHVVQDAPIITQPVYMVIHVRKKHFEKIREAVKILRSITDGYLKN